jgi:phosphate-selective porin OprO/OprP
MLRYPGCVIATPSTRRGSAAQARSMAAAAGALMLALALAPGAGAQFVPVTTPADVEPTPAPTPVPTPVAEPEAADASPPPDEPGTRVEAVPEADEDASSDRIRYRDPLDIDYEPVKDKWERFEQSLLGITRYSFFDDKLRFRLGFRFQGDGTLVTPSDQLEADFGEMTNRADFRRLRLFAEGIWGTMYFRAEFDVAADAGVKTAYLEGRNGGLEIWGHLLGKFRFGYFQEPFGLEKNVSSFDTTFAEVSLPIESIGPGNNLGAMVYDASANRRFTWAVGASSWGRETEDNASGSLLSLSGRFGYQPVRYNDGRRMLHLGLSISSRSPTGDTERFEARPEARFVSPFADTGDIPTYTNNLLGLEAAWKGGSSWAQAEWIQSRLDSPETDDPHFGGIALQAGTFLTGQSRPWDDLFGVWGRVRPEQAYRGGNPFKAANGGVWELAARYSMVDLTDGTVEGGEVRDVTAGVNWYPNSTSKLQFNWVHSRVEDSGHANIWVLRYQFAIK